MTTTLYTSQQLSNERYHSAEFPQASGSILAAIYGDCPAAWRYGEPKTTPQMAEGVSAHVALLEPNAFESKYARGIDPDDYPDALVTGKDLEGWCRESGIKGYSGKKKDELIDFVLANSAGENIQIFDVIERDHAKHCEENKLEVIPAKVYDTVKKMRDVIFLNGYGDLLGDGATEVSLIGKELKVRFDFVGDYSGPVIVDYKTTSSAHPEAFGAQAWRMHYWLKMALQRDMFVEHYGFEPKVILLAQSTKPPYLVQAYQLTKEQLAVGREQYQMAHKSYLACMKSNSWPAYGGAISELQTPSWVARQFQFE